MEQEPKRRFSKKWLILGLLVVVVGLPVGYFTFRRDVYSDPRPEDVVELFRAKTYQYPPMALLKIGGWIGQKNRFYEFYCDRNKPRQAKANSAFEKLLESEYRIETISYLIEALKDEDWCVRYFAAIALGDIGPEAKKAVPALIEALKDEDENVRGNAAIALGKIGPDAKDSVPALIEALKNESEWFRDHAKDALNLIDSQAARNEGVE